MAELYTPKGCTTLADEPPQQIRLGFQGYAGVGKTWAGCTFPNVVAANIDRGLGAHIGRSDIINVPFYSEKWCKEFNPNHKWKRDTIVKWIKTEGMKLTPEQTLLFDGISGLDEAYHAWYAQNLVYTKQGKVDDYAEYRLKLDFFSDFFDLIIGLNCNVVAIAHEYEKMDKIDTTTGKIRPLMSGQYANKLTSKFTDWFRQHASNKPPIDKIDEKMLKLWDMSKDEFVAMMDTFPRNTMYYWQLESDDVFDGKCSSLVNFPRFIPANYQSFMKYTRHPVCVLPDLAISQ